MIVQLLNAFRKSLRNPRYLLYFAQNVDVIRDHFPRLHMAMRRRRLVRVGEPGQLRKLHVIMRTTDLVMNINSPRLLEDVGIKTRNDVIRIGGCSLFTAAANFAAIFGKENLRITLVTDRLSDEGMKQYRSAAESVNLGFDVVQSKGHGNGPSFQTQVDVALQDDDDTLELILEDDYLLHDDALTIPFKLMRDHSCVSGIDIQFEPGRIWNQDIGKLVAVDGRLYCRVPSTTCTFFMTVNIMRKYEKYMRLYDGWEKGSIGVVWRKEICLAPLGWTLSEHLHRECLSPVQKLLGGCDKIEFFSL